MADIIPKKMIRRFDVFAEYNRIKNERKGMPSDQAKGYALWLAKVVAARKFAKTPKARAEMTDRLGSAFERFKAGEKFLELSGEPQTDDLFDKEIVKRMGTDFYREVFSPAISKSVEEHQSYESIRDSIRVNWNFEKKAA